MYTASVTHQTIDNQCHKSLARMMSCSVLVVKIDDDVSIKMGQIFLLENRTKFQTKDTGTFSKDVFSQGAVK